MSAYPGQPLQGSIRCQFVHCPYLGCVTAATQDLQGLLFMDRPSLAKKPLQPLCCSLRLVALRWLSAQEPKWAEKVARDHLIHYTGPAMPSRALMKLSKGSPPLRSAACASIQQNAHGWHGNLLRSDSTPNCVAKSFLRKSKVPFNQLTGCSETSTSPVLSFFLTCMCVSPCVS